MDKEAIKRAIELMEIAAKYIEDSADNDREVFYDEAVCDGGCLAADLRGAIELLS